MDSSTSSRPANKKLKKKDILRHTEYLSRGCIACRVYHVKYLPKKTRDIYKEEITNHLRKEHNIDNEILKTPPLSKKVAPPKEPDFASAYETANPLTLPPLPLSNSSPNEKTALEEQKRLLDERDKIDKANAEA